MRRSSLRSGVSCGVVVLIFCGYLLWSIRIEQRQRTLDNALFDCILKYDLAGAQRLIDQGADVNARNENGQFRPTTIIEFIHRSFDRDAGMTPLMSAASRPDSRMVGLLLRNGARVNDRNSGWGDLTAVDYAKTVNGSDWVTDEGTKVTDILLRAGGKDNQGRTR